MATRSPSVATARTGRTALTKNRARAEALLTRVAGLQHTIARSFFDLGVTLREIYDEELHVALGLPSFEALLKERTALGHSSAYELIAIVTNVPKAVALRLGRAKAYALARYAGAEHEAVAAVAKRPSARGSARATQGATRERTPAAPAARTRAETAAREMEHRLDRAGAAASVAVHARGKTWRLVVDLAVEDALLVAPKS